MRLFGKVDGSINRSDRPSWIWSIFDLAFQSPGGALVVRASSSYTTGSASSGEYTIKSRASTSYTNPSVSQSVDLGN